MTKPIESSCYPLGFIYGKLWPFLVPSPLINLQTRFLKMKLDLALIIRSEPDRVKLKGSTKSGIWEDTIVTEVKSIIRFRKSIRLVVYSSGLFAAVRLSQKALERPSKKLRLKSHGKKIAHGKRLYLSLLISDCCAFMNNTGHWLEATSFRRKPLFLATPYKKNDGLRRVKKRSNGNVGRLVN